MFPVMKLSSKLWLVLSSQQNARLVAQQLTCEESVASVDSSTFHNQFPAFCEMPHGVRLLPFSLSEIYQFDGLMQHSLSKKGSTPLLLYAGTEPAQQVAVTFLLGCHLLMTHGLAFEEVVLALRPLQAKIGDVLGPLGCAAFSTALRAVCCARCLDWIDFRQDSDDRAPRKCRIEMDECLHYSRYAAHSRIFMRI